MYPIQTKHQPFSFYIIVSFGQWIFSALELIPSLLIGDMEYLHNDYHCQVAPSSMRGSLIVCVLGFLFPFIIIACSYVYTIYYIRQHSSTIITTKQRKSMRRDMIILKRVLIILTLLTSSAAPHAFFPVAYRFLGSLPTWHILYKKWNMDSSQLQRVAQCISGSESGNEVELESSNNSESFKKKAKQNRRKWVPLCTYNNKDDAITKIKNDGIRSKTHINITSEGKWVYDRCSQVKRHGKQSPVDIHLLYHSENECVTMYGTGLDHLHQQPKSTGIN
ncbi:unnamed protein product [Rotaria sordida]|uniref:G-protein coupled receptors family 1 profile domain-containing protein n=1 Tax=Rotaria sordida TaxID=392033 RepID=A0A813ZL00_9BILA|nr:unnamed protein product [Rotaria sordida]CAF3776887.1 unnamed protein product [Rotaria sordida]CAF3884463.1 unnamed protein product [Rotaria sordida]